MDIGITPLWLARPFSSRAPAAGIGTIQKVLQNLLSESVPIRDLEKILGMHVNEINKYLGTLEESGKIETVEQDRGTFYQIRIT